MPVAVVKTKTTNQQSNKQKKVLSIKSHSFPTFLFILLTFFSNFLFFSIYHGNNNSNKSNNNNNKSFETIDRLARLD